MNEVTLNFEERIIYMFEVTDTDVALINNYVKNYSNKNVKNLKFEMEDPCFGMGDKEICLSFDYLFTKEELEDLDVENINDIDEVINKTFDSRIEIFTNVESALNDLLSASDRNFEAFCEFSDLNN